MDEVSNYYAVILAGGGGTRLWPKSRRKHPKHLLKLFGDEQSSFSNKTLLEITYERINKILPNEKIFVITHIDHEELVRKELPKLPQENIIAEPIAKNTALAMGTAAAVIHSKNPNASIIYLAADHIFTKEDRFAQNALASLKVVSSGDYIVAIGIRPTHAHTGLGYIKIGEEQENLSKVAQKGFVFKVKEFKEKPNLVTAQSFVASGQYLWNANLYSWSSNTIFKAFEKYSPEVYKAVMEIAQEWDKGRNNELLEKVYSKVGSPSSIDYEVSEKADNIMVIPGDFGWSDIGDWSAVYDTLKKDSDGNAVVDQGNVLMIDTKNSLVEANGKLVVTVGVSDLVVIDTEDAILIVPKSKSQDVKKVVEKLKIEKKEYL